MYIISASYSLYYAYTSSTKFTKMAAFNPNQVFNLEVSRSQSIRGMMWGMTRRSNNSVAIGYNDGNGIDIINTVSYQERYTDIPNDIGCYDLVFKEDGSLCVSTGVTEAHLYSPNGSRKSLNRVEGNHYLGLNISSLDEIFIVNGEKKVYRYSETSSTPRFIETDKEAAQVSITRSGLIVTSSCNFTNPSVVQVYESETNRVLKKIEAPDDVHLYAAVDDEDRMYVASVNSKKGNVVFSLYDIRGRELTERDIKIEIPDLAVGFSWAYMVSLSSEMLAFACGKKVHFIKVSL